MRSQLTTTESAELRTITYLGFGYRDAARRSYARARAAEACRTTGAAETERSAQ